MKLVMANGCFDVLHVGHIEHLQQARWMGDKLIIALTTDDGVRREKGTDRPIVPWCDRCAVLMAMEMVDGVVPSENAAEAILLYRPSIYVKGIDYAASGVCVDDRTACLAVGAEIAFTTSLKHSSTAMIEKIRGLK